MLWSHPQTNRYQVHANTPVYHDGGLFCFSGYGQGGVKLELSADGSSVTKSWFSDKLDSRMGGMVYVNGYLYTDRVTTIASGVVLTGKPGQKNMPIKDHWQRRYNIMPMVCCIATAIAANWRWQKQTPQDLK
jgi:hypothetical protein